MKHWLRHPTLTLAISAALAFASGTAAALGLGQIEVRSRAGEPLLAEIPVISTTPGEVEQLQARLASPETFARIGLQPPQGVVTDLRFEVAYNRSGRPIIRVTTDQPIEQPLLTFLVEVDWGQGRLVREYSALVDTPRAVAAPVQPPVQAPVGAPSNTIQRPVTSPTKPLPIPAPAPQRPSAAAASEPSPAQDVPGEYGPVRNGETLSAITARLGLGDGATLDQAMIAMLRANPDAFIGGDINQLKRGAVLRVPPAAEVAAVDAAQAAQIVRDRMRQWREARRQALIASEQADASQAAARSGQTSPAEGRAGSEAPKPVRPQPADGARLEIVPPAANRATQAGTQSGTQAGGEGQMLQQELQQTRETLAVRDAELQELKSRVAELEKLQSDQQRLIAMKSAELAAAQQRLGSRGEATAATPAEPADASGGGTWLPWLLGAAALMALLFAWWRTRQRTPAPSPFRAPTESSASALAAAFPLRRDADADEDLLVVQPAVTDAGAIAPVASSRVDARPSEADQDEVDASAELPVEDEGLEDAGVSTADPHVAVWDGPDLAHEDAEPVEEIEVTPLAWQTPERPAVTPAAPAPLEQPDEQRPETVPEAPIEEVRTPARPWIAPVAPVPMIEPGQPNEADRPKEPDQFDRPNEPNEPDRPNEPDQFDQPNEPRVQPVADAQINERIELAQAYLDLGDSESARQLLGEVAINGDHASRQRALRMLRELE
ncbi:FimV/HubP family polar landmark protein [Lysobacter korlensis]|uniref:FimV/HubP family polar landmark protein n=1 Tax=Lysobacter korlensis TaxID=553636 RepID=A0ABV6RQC9_9GAMM